MPKNICFGLALCGSIRETDRCAATTDRCAANTDSSITQGGRQWRLPPASYKYLQLQTGRRGGGHAWEGGIAHSSPGSAWSTSLSLFSSLSFVLRYCGRFSRFIPPLCAASMLRTPGTGSTGAPHRVLAWPLSKLMFYGC